MTIDESYLSKRRALNEIELNAWGYKLFVRAFGPLNHKSRTEATK